MFPFLGLYLECVFVIKNKKKAMENKIWRCSSDGKENIVDRLIKESGVMRSVALYLASRGITPETLGRYLNATFADLSDPFRFAGIETAVQRLWQAIRNRERILIHGDYDTDGITATALLSWVLERNGGLVTSFLPHRFDDGYGFTPDSLLKALETVPGGKCGVLVTVDCGINSAEAVQKARELGIDVIITDHHEPADELPEALATINPKLDPVGLDDLLHLAGVGVAFKLSHAFVIYGRAHNEGGYTTDMQEVLDFVALGTVADIVPLLGENRILVKYGMEMLKKQLRPGVNALIQHAKVDANIQPSDITFKLAPRLNAAGRLGNASSALALMTADNIVDAYEYAAKLDEFNQRRQAKEQEIFLQAKAQVESAPGFASNMSIIAAGENWHQGVIGIVASRFARDYNRPTIVLTIIGNEAHGSGRSVGTLNLIKILSRCSHLLTRYGGHPMAVGLGMNKDKIAEFQQEFEKCVREEAKPSDLTNYINYDGVARLDELNEEFFHYHGMLGPFGHGNPQPLYLIRGLEIARLSPIRPVHTKGVFMDEYGSTCDFIAFNKHLDMGMRWDVIAQPQMNEYYGERKRQLQVIDFRPSAD